MLTPNKVLMCLRLLLRFESFSFGGEEVPPVLLPTNCGFLLVLICCACRVLTYVNFLGLSGNPDPTNSRVLFRSPAFAGNFAIDSFAVGSNNLLPGVRLPASSPETTSPGSSISSATVETTPHSARTVTKPAPWTTVNHAGAVRTIAAKVRHSEDEYHLS